MRNLMWKQSALAVGLMAAGVVWADYTITDLGALGGLNSRGYGLNNNGDVVGDLNTASNSQHAFLNSGSMIDIHSAITSNQRSAAQAINDSGQMVGFYSTADEASIRAFLYDGGLVTDIGTFGGVVSDATDINSIGEVVGQASMAGGGMRAFKYSSGALANLGTLGGGGSTAYGINDLGDVVGVSSLAGNTVSHAFMYTNGVMVDLGALGTGLYSAAQDINNSGDVVGSSYTTPGYTAQHAFVYSGGIMTDLGVLGGTESVALGINDNGDVVGQYRPSSSVVRAFLYANGTMQDLNSLLPVGSGWTLLSATDINDYGQITGVGELNGNQRAFLMTPGC
jgi:probable HAF family extracellular repeat protein